MTGGMIVGLLGGAVAGSVIAVVLAFGVLVGASSGLGYATAVRVVGTVASGRGLALGLVVSAYGVGSAALAPVASVALLVLACLPLAFGTRDVIALAALLVLGAQYGALSTLTPAATADVTPPDRFGSTFGLVFTGWGAAGLLAPVSGAAIAPTIGFDGVYLLFLTVAALGWGCVATYTRLARPVRS